MNANRQSRRRDRAIGRGRKPGGFTLVELLVVVVIIVLVSAATLPVVLPALSHRQVSEGARLLQATIAGARDAALRANAPRGIRLMPDPLFPGGSSGTLAANRMIAIEPAPDYSTGRVSIYQAGAPNNPYVPAGNLPVGPFYQISVTEEIWANPAPTIVAFGAPGYNTLPNEPTSWYYNIRQGDKIRFDDSGTYYTVAGPFLRGAYSGGVPYNPERYVNEGAPGTVIGPTGGAVTNNPNPLSGAHYPEILFLVNGLDDDNDGWIDEGFDGIDNDGDGVIDPGYNGIDDDGDGVIDNPAELFYPMTGPPGGEWEPEKFVGNQYNGSFLSQKYTIFRRPVVSEGAREVALPQGVVIDMTTWNASSTVVAQTSGNQRPILLASQGATPTPERSRLPVDPFSYYVDVMIAPNGQVVPSGAGTAMVQSGAATTSPTSNLPFYHFWVAERDDVMAPIWGVNNPSLGTSTTSSPLVGAPIKNPNYPAQKNLLPMPEGFYQPVDASGNPSNGPYLKGDRRLVTLFVKSGQVITNEVENFNVVDLNVPYYSAQFGTREAK